MKGIDAEYALIDEEEKVAIKYMTPAVRAVWKFKSECVF